MRTTPLTFLGTNRGMTNKAAIPVRPVSTVATGGSKIQSVHRMLACHALVARAGHHDNATKFRERTWPDDSLAAMLVRATSSAHTTSNSADLVQTLASTILTGI